MTWPAIKRPWYKKLILVRNIVKLLSRKQCIAKFDKIQMPMVRQRFPKLLAEDLVGIQPMTKEPVNSIFNVTYHTPTRWGRFKRFIWRT